MKNDIKINELFKVRGDTKLVTKKIEHNRYYYQKGNFDIWIGTKFYCFILGFEIYKNAFIYCFGPFMLSISEGNKKVLNYPFIYEKQINKKLWLGLKFNYFALGIEKTSKQWLIYLGPILLIHSKVP